MKLAFLRRTLVGLVLALVLAPLAGHADEGFWLFNRVPAAAIKAAYGVELSDAWLTRVQRASVRFPSGSGSFVSPDGLVLTNHHVAMEILQKLSTAERDLVKNGFLARDRAQEMRAPDLELLTLQRITDVTDKVNASVKAAMSPAETLAARRTAIAALEKDAKTGDQVEAEVVTLYQGGQYHLYEYRKFTDVRLVFAPEFDIGFFGGDPDNFTFPRYNLDMTLFRVYDNGAPLRSEHFLPWSAEGAKAGDPVFTSGHPGATQRLNTVAHLELIRDHALPLSLDIYGTISDALAAYSKQSPEAERQAKDLLFSLENARKSWRGQLAGLRDPALMKKKAGDEAALKAKVAADPAWRERFGGAWDAIAKARGAQPDYNLERVMFESGLALFSDYFTFARTLVRWAEESGKPNGERLPEYTDARKPAIERQLTSEAPIYPEYEKARLAASLGVFQEKLGKDHPLVQKVLAGKAPAARAAELVDGTKLGDPAFRKQLWEGGAEAIRKAEDPFLEVARAIEPRARELRTRYDTEVVAVERDAYAQIAQAVFAVAGDTAYPDGTFTLRLSYGSVSGYLDEGARIEPFTDLKGLYERAHQHGNKAPWALPQSWIDARSRVKRDTPYNLVSTNDIVGGNSGSPLINAKGELVGLIFDGNIQSLPGYFVYDGGVNRAVSVDVRGMREALASVYQAEALVAELMNAAAVPSPAR